MLQIQGFVTIQGFIDPSDNVSHIGELSSYAKTFDKIVNKYSRSINPELDLFVYGAENVVDTTVNFILNLSEYIRLKAFSLEGLPPPDTLINDVNTNFSGAIADFAPGNIVQAIDKQGMERSFPAWVQFIITLDGQNIPVRIWYSEPSFRLTYLDYQIEIIPPFDNINPLSLSKATVINALSLPESKQHGRLDKLRDVISDKPCTRIVPMTYKWFDPANLNDPIDLTWTFVIYGQSGDNPDAIRDAVARFILTSPDIPQQLSIAEWQIRLPEIFNVSEFIITPQWDEYALPNQSIQQGVYSPLVRLRRVLGIKLLTAPTYETEHVVRYCQVTSVLYKSLALMIVSSQGNPTSSRLLNEVHPEYVNMASGNLDWSRIPTEVRNFINQLTTAIILAEDFNGFTQLPIGYNRVERNNVEYILFSNKSVQWLVVTKRSFYNLLELIEDDNFDGDWNIDLPDFDPLEDDEPVLPPEPMDNGDSSIVDNNGETTEFTDPEDDGSVAG